MLRKNSRPSSRPQKSTVSGTSSAFENRARQFCGMHSAGNSSARPAVSSGCAWEAITLTRPPMLPPKRKIFPLSTAGWALRKSTRASASSRSVKRVMSVVGKPLSSRVLPPQKV